MYIYYSIEKIFGTCLPVSPSRTLRRPLLLAHSDTQSSECVIVLFLNYHLWARVRLTIHSLCKLWYFSICSHTQQLYVWYIFTNACYAVKVYLQSRKHHFFERVVKDDSILSEDFKLSCKHTHMAGYTLDENMLHVLVLMNNWSSLYKC